MLSETDTIMLDTIISCSMRIWFFDHKKTLSGSFGKQKSLNIAVGIRIISRLERRHATSPLEKKEIFFLNIQFLHVMTCWLLIRVVLVAIWFSVRLYVAKVHKNTLIRTHFSYMYEKNISLLHNTPYTNYFDLCSLLPAREAISYT